MTTITKTIVSYNYDIDAHNIIPTGDINLFLENGWEWFDFVGEKYRDNEYVPYKTRAVLTKSDTAALFIIENKSSIENRYFDHIKQGALREAESFNKPATYSNKYKKYVPPCPAGEEYERHQVIAARWMLDRKRLLLADKPGLGKTISAFASVNSIADVEKRKPRVLIISPAKVMKSWRKESSKWAIGYNESEIQLFNSKEYVSGETKMLITNYESLDGNIADFINYKADIVISDESHLVKNGEALRTQNLAWLVKHARYNLLMTGTPILNRHSELYTLVELIAPGLLPHYHCFPFYQKELKELLIDHVMLMRDKKVLKHKIPEHNNFHHLVEVKLEDSYAGFKKPQSVIRHEVGRAKIAKTVEMANKMLKTENKIVIFVYHTDVADKIAELLGYDYEVVVSHGKKTKKQCSQAEDDFKIGTARVFVAAIKSCSAGLTLIEAKRMIIAELEWTPANLEQSEMRISRIGQTEPTEAHYIIAKGIDVEERMLEVIDFKNKITSIF